jgi:hypothetical protein
MQIRLEEEEEKVELPSTPLSTIVRKDSLPLKNTAPCRGNTSCNKCAEFLEIGYDNTLCSLSGRPYTPLPKVPKDHPAISEGDLIKRRTYWIPLPTTMTSTGKPIHSI